MKNLIFSAALLLSLGMSAQKNDCTQLENELQKIKTENTELTKQNLYYKETFDLLKPVASDAKDLLKFDIVKAVGSKTKKTLKIYYIYTNTSSKVRSFFQPAESYIVDPQGNQTSTYEVFASEDRRQVNQIQPDVPMKGLLSFNVRTTDFPVIKLLNLKFYKVDGFENAGDTTLNFKNIPVFWTD